MFFTGKSKYKIFILRVEYKEGRDVIVDKHILTYESFDQVLRILPFWCANKKVIKASIEELL